MIAFHLLQADSTSVSLPATFAIDPQTRGSTHCSQVQEADALQNAQQSFFLYAVWYGGTRSDRWAGALGERSFRSVGRRASGRPTLGDGRARMSPMGKSRVTARHMMTAVTD